MLMRAAAWFALYTIKDPDTKFFFLIIPSVHVMFFATKILAESYTAKMFPKDIRGMLNSVYGMLFTIASFVYLTYIDWLFKKSARLPFLGVAITDVLIALLVIILSSTG